MEKTKEIKDMHKSPEDLTLGPHGSKGEIDVIKLKQDTRNLEIKSNSDIKKSLEIGHDKQRNLSIGMSNATPNVLQGQMMTPHDMEQLHSIMHNEPNGDQNEKKKKAVKTHPEEKTAEKHE